MLSSALKPNRCKHCKVRMPEDKARHVLHEECIAPFLDKLSAKKAADRKKKERAQRVVDKAARERLQRISDLIKLAQRVFNAFIRERDRLAGHPCISSGRALDWSGNAVDAGHYRSTGAASHLRFNEDNCHAQSKHDNQWLAGNAVDYRINLIRRIGLERVEALEADNTVCKWTADELRAIRATYTTKRKALLNITPKGQGDAR
ncbi:recombination protein NinG [Variovorax sp. GB1P17]|uniref:recombination protein NinG n=1 Tax=Variovorax sp. GB1P17 TaxID=3443740 RepID=UPI003F45E60E